MPNHLFIHIYMDYLGYNDLQWCKRLDVENHGKRWERQKIVWMSDGFCTSMQMFRRGYCSLPKLNSSTLRMIFRAPTHEDQLMEGWSMGYSFFYKWKNWEPAGSEDFCSVLRFYQRWFQSFHMISRCANWLFDLKNPDRTGSLEVQKCHSFTGPWVSR